MLTTKTKHKLYTETETNNETFGKNKPLDTDANIPNVTNKNAKINSNEQDIKEWDNHMCSLNKVQDEIKMINEKETEKQGDYFNKNKREFEYRIGDKVWKKNKILSSAADNVTAKLAPNYIGPYTIKKRISENIYLLKDECNRELTSHCHAKELKLIYGNSGKTETRENSNAKQQCEPERTIAPQRKRGRPETRREQPAADRKPAHTPSATAPARRRGRPPKTRAPPAP